MADPKKEIGITDVLMDRHVRALLATFIFEIRTLLDDYDEADSVFGEAVREKLNSWAGEIEIASVHEEVNNTSDDDLDKFLDF